MYTQYLKPKCVHFAFNINKIKCLVYQAKKLHKTCKSRLIKPRKFTNTLLTSRGSITPKVTLLRMRSRKFNTNYSTLRTLF